MCQIANSRGGQTVERQLETLLLMIVADMCLAYSVPGTLTNALHGFL